VTNVLDERGRVVPLRGGAKLSITSLIADYDGMTGQPRTRTRIAPRS
jgi:hypothetical protein